MKRVFVVVTVCAYLMIVKGSPVNTAHENTDIAVTTTTTTALPLNTRAEPYLNPTPTPTEDVNAESTTVPSLPPLFGSILSTLRERLNATMELPLLQGERDKIMQSTLQGLKRCKEQHGSTNIRLRYRLCVDKEVQGALKKARAVELRVFNPASLNMGEGGRMLPIPGEVQHREIFEVSKKLPDVNSV